MNYETIENHLFLCMVCLKPAEPAKCYKLPYLNSCCANQLKWIIHKRFSLLHYRQKIWNIFYFSDFLHFCGVCRAFLYLRYISTSKYYFWGSWFALNSKMKHDGSKIIISVFFSIRSWLEFLLSLCQIAAISIRVLYRDIVHNTIVYLLLILVRSAGD